MPNTPDYTAAFKDMMSMFPVDTKAMENMFRSQTALAERMSAVAIEAAQKSTDLSARWTQDTLSKMADITKVKTEPTDYAKSMTAFASASAESAAEHMAAFAEIAKSAQTETLELMLSAGKDMQDEAAAATRKAQGEASSAAMNATA
ncbi:phasin family protein [Pseudoroseicyclus tamaricis]|uniref:Phasin n=1 Tax=Pseudoroseicyclus tamaricis TaxID=2705421 RepID=A0A6B2JT05_9RHOB|nr:phasin family protein [Pseudoroseicyclus tamaricis]NDV01368.1 Phasin [Pseudoroseicyclus tamaricis]